MKYSLVFFFSLGFSFTTFALEKIPSKKKSVVKIAIIDWCPALCPGKKAPGYIHEIVQEVFKDSKYTTKYTLISPWTRAIESVMAGKNHALLSPVKPEAPKLVYPQYEVGVQKTCFFVKVKDKWNFDGEKSLLDNRLISVIKDNSLLEYDNFVKMNPKIFHYLNHSNYIERALKMISANRINTLTFTKIETEYYLHNNNLTKEFRNAGCVSTAKLFMGFSPVDRVYTRELILFFDKRMAKIKQSNIIPNILKKYGLNDWNK
jgi:polar amino acid transport system substrate-binding protein